MITINDLDHITIEGIDLSDYPELCDAFIASARWRDTGKELTEQELRQIDIAELHDLALLDALSL